MPWAMMGGGGTNKDHENKAKDEQIRLIKGKELTNNTHWDYKGKYLILSP